MSEEVLLNTDPLVDKKQPKTDKKQQKISFVHAVSQEQPFLFILSFFPPILLCIGSGQEW